MSNILSEQKDLNSLLMEYCVLRVMRFYEGGALPLPLPDVLALVQFILGVFRECAGKDAQHLCNLLGYKYEQHP